LPALTLCLSAWAFSVVASDSLSAAERPDTLATVCDHGAIGDGVVDDTAAIQRAVDSGAGDILFPKGSYRISATILVDLGKIGFTSLSGAGVAQLVMTGPGPAVRFVGTHFRSADPGGFTDDVWQRQRMPTIDGLGILGAHPSA
jgi:hypothetical protein